MFFLSHLCPLLQVYHCRDLTRQEEAIEKIIWAVYQSLYWCAWKILVPYEAFPVELPIFWFSRRLADGTRGLSQVPHISSSMENTLLFSSSA